MWDKFVHDLHFLWSKLWSPLLAASLTVLFAYLLKRRDERRELRRKLSGQLYIPVLQQLSEAEPLIRNHVRAHSVTHANLRATNQVSFTPSFAVALFQSPDYKAAGRWAS
jgi:hypothetical protein